jgi:histidine triad (HIT) family protein
MRNPLLAAISHGSTMKFMLRLACAAALCFAAQAFGHTGAITTDKPTVDRQLDGRYDPQNPFAKILRGELPADKVYEDADVVAFLSTNQKAPGHVLVISKTSQARNILDMSPADLTQVMLVAKRVASAERIALGADGLIVQQNNGAAAGQTVFHLHVHVIPCWNGKPPSFARDKSGQLDRKALAARIAAAMH